jgi:hypothetical protein
MTWRYFVGACVLAGGLLFKAGAPAAAIFMGMAGAAGINWWRLSRR